MKKIIFLTIIFLIIITLSGCTNKDESINKDQNSPAQSTSKEEMSDGSQEKESGILNSIKDSLSKGKTLVCAYKSNEDNLDVEVKTYIEGDKYKTEFLSDGKKNYSIFDGKISYSWEEGSSQGIKINTDCLKDLDNNSGSEENMEDIAKFEDLDKDYADLFDGATDVECQEVDSVEFAVPDNIKFIDQCQMLKEQQDLINDLDGQIPAGLPQF